jgi:hypothetical protein
MSNNYGAKFSKKGYNARTCADRFLAFSSEFQTLKYNPGNRYTVTGVVPVSGTITITITHNLNFYAPFEVTYNGRTALGFNTSREVNGAAFPSPPIRQYTDRLEIDVENEGPLLDYEDCQGQTVQFTVYIYYDDFRTVNPLSINTDTSFGSENEDYGMEFSKDGFDIKTCTDDQKTFSTNFPSEIVHKKGIDTSHVAMQKEIYHGLNYIPSYLAFCKKTNENFIMQIGAERFTEGTFLSGQEYATLTNIVMWVYDFFADDYRTDYDFYYIIFKTKINS